MRKFNQFDKKQLKIPIDNIQIGDSVELVKEIGPYSVGCLFEFTGYVSKVKPDIIIKMGGIGETYFSDRSGKNILFQGKESKLLEIFSALSPKQIFLKEVKKQPELKPIVTEKIIIKEIPITGEPGNRGERGFIGSNGSKGDKGDKGDRGETGWTGYPGDKGLQGVDGPVGAKGDKGDTGEQGIKGDTGEPGIKGDTGDKGDTGEQGLQGIQGLSGKDGSDGSQGIPGLLGERGEQGIQGLQGIPGKDGKDGKQGQQGISGINGKDGINGEKGEAGKNGDSGIVEVSYPLKLNDKSLSIETQFLTDIVTNSSKVNVAQGGGGSNVRVEKDGKRFISVLKSISFTGDGVNISKNGNNLIVNVPTSAPTENAPENTPTYVTSLELINGDLVVNYSNSTSVNLGDVLDLDGGTFPPS